MSRTSPFRFAAPAVVLLGLAACNRGQAADDARAGDSAAAPAPVVAVGPENVVVAGADTIATGPSLSGALQPEREAQIRAQIGGTVLRTQVEQGQRVGRGTLLAVLDESAIRDQFLGARSGVASAQNNAEVAQRELQRATTLAQAGAIAERDVEGARRATTAAQAALADAQARLAGAQQQLDRTRITAPIAGVVAQRQVSAGDAVAPGAAMFTIVDPSSMRLEASVPAEQLGALRVGLPVQFTVSGYPGRAFTGRVSRISPVADPQTRQVRIFVSLPNAGNTLVGGLFAEGRVATETRLALQVPTAAVDLRGLEPSVMRVRNGAVEKVAVQLGIRDDQAERVEIKSGIAAGDTLLLGAAQGVNVGTRVRVSAPTDSK